MFCLLWDNMVMARNTISSTIKAGQKKRCDLSLDGTGCQSFHQIYKESIRASVLKKKNGFLLEKSAL